MALSDLAIRNIKPPEKGQKDYPDQNGLSLRVSQGGTKTFVLRYGREQHRLTVGRYPIISLKIAREIATQKLAEITLHGHKPKSLTFAEGLDLFIENHLKAKNRPATAKETERLLRKALPRFGRAALSEIQTSQIAAFLDGHSGTPSEANHLYVALKTFCGFAFRRGYIEANPLARLQKPHKTNARSRVLTATELRSVLITAMGMDTTYTRLLRLLIYSGQRLAQVQYLTGRHVDREARTFTWTAEEMKGDENQIIPFHDLTAALLGELPKDGWFFPGEEDPQKPYTNFSNDHRAFLDASGVPHFRRHDLRRVYSTFHAREIGTPPHIVEQILAHKNGRESGGPIGRIYRVYRWEREMRNACQAWERYLSDLVGGNGAA
jgi:integrase